MVPNLTSVPDTDEGAVAQNLRQAAASGRLIENPDGTLQLPGDRSLDLDFIRVGDNPNCRFLKKFLFRRAYAEAVVPAGCQACFKIKVAPKTLRELVAAWRVAQRIECSSKWGIDLDNPLSQDIYAGYFYLTSLPEARALFKVVREAFDAEPKLGPDVRTFIKRGCSVYEAIVGPSDQWQYTPEMVQIEARLKARFRTKPRRTVPNSAVLARWIDLAFRIGDDTYLDFTDGKRLRPKTLTYEP
jgi:hypothetical protein